MSVGIIVFGARTDRSDTAGIDADLGNDDLPGRGAVYLSQQRVAR